MIPVERSKELPDDAVTKALAESDGTIAEMERWFKKLATARSKGKPDPEKPKLSFKQYKAAAVKETLSLLFAGKCAYCESFYSSTQPMDVEHYRPKGAVSVERDSDKDHPGYYWLAATWENLLPSCIDCNRQRTQEEVIDGDTTATKKLGKKDRFPVAGTRAKRPDQDLGAEEPLLLDPSVDDPHKFLEYDLGLGIVLPRTKSGKKHDRAIASIEVYGLNRSGLVQDRRHVIRLIDHRLTLIARLAALRDEIADQPDVQQVLDEVVAQEIAVLREMRQPNRPYSGLVRQILQELDEIAAVLPSN